MTYEFKNSSSHFLPIPKGEGDKHHVYFVERETLYRNSICSNSSTKSRADRRIDVSVFGTNREEKQFFPFFFPPVRYAYNIPPPIEGVTSFDRERSFDPLFGAVVTPFDRNHSIRYGRLNPAAALAPFHIPLSSVNLPTCFKPSLSPPLRVSFAPVRVPIDGER